MIKKEHDWFLENMINSDFTNSEFKTIGLDANNTSLQDPDFYKNNPKIREHFTNENGNFDEQAFNQVYQKALFSYNTLSQDTWESDLDSKMSFSQNDIFVDIKQRRQSPELFINFQGTPFYNGREYVSSISTLGKNTPTDRSLEEVAQTQKTFDPSTEEWSDSPNDSFFNDFFETKVIAAWDYDADINGNPTDDLSKIVYQKGDIKLNSAGLPYYENLNGRSVVGKTVLHKSDILTTDGSFWNKFDIFDSDDIETPTYKVVAKNLAMAAPLLAGPLGLPIVANLYIGAGVAMSMADVMTTGAKLFMGSEVDFLNNTEGFLDSLQLSPSKSESKSMWTLNNFVDLAGSVFLQLAQQRWLFKYSPLLLKGETLDIDKVNAKNLDKLQTKLMADIEKATDLGDTKAIKKLIESGSTLGIQANTMTRSYVQQYQKLGEELSRLYMVGIVTADGYNQAKAEGLSDTEAAFFTAGYALAEYFLLKSDVGKWILPELKMDKQVLNKALSEVSKPMAEKFATSKIKSEATKKSLNALEWIKRGVQKASIEDKIGKNIASFAISNALAEGVEETSEEMLLDFVKALGNGYFYLTGQEPKFKLFQDWQTRYSMSFLGGMMGGGLFSITPDIKHAYEGIKNMNFDQATAELLGRVRNGEVSTIHKAINNRNWGDINLSYIPTKNDKGEQAFLPASSETDSQDALIKSALHHTVSDMDKILTLHGAKVSDNTLKSVFDEIKFVRVVESSQFKQFVHDFSDHVGNLYSNAAILSNLKLKDNASEEEQKAYDEQVAKLTKEINESKKAIQDFKDGKMSNDYILDALFETQSILSSEFVPTFDKYVEHLKHTTIDKLNENELKFLTARYSAFLDGTLLSRIHEGRLILDSLIDKVSPSLDSNFIDSVQFRSSLTDKLQDILNIEKSLNIKKLQSLDQAKIYLGSLDREIYRAIIDTYNGSDSYFATKLQEFLQTNDSYINVINQLNLLENNVENFSEKLRLEGKRDSILETSIDTILRQELNKINPNKLDIFSGINKHLKNVIYQSLDHLQLGEYEYNILELKDNIEQLPDTGALKLLDVMQSSLETNLNVSSILNTLNSNVLAHRDALEEVTFDESIIKKIDDILHLISLSRSVIYAHREDAEINPKVQIVFGYNIAKNQLLGTNLLTIDRSITDPLIKELDSLASQFKFFKDLSTLNKNRKLKIQKNTSINTINLLAKKIERFARLVTNWEGYDELKEALENSFLILQESIDFDKVDELEFEKQRAVLELAVHNFLNKNRDNLTNKEEINRVFSLDNFKFIDADEEILTDQSKTISDVSFFWYLSALTATNPNNYNFKYKEILNGKFAPLITQELAAYIGYSQLTNKETFDLFVNIKNQIIENSKAERTEYYNNTFPKDSGVYVRFGDIVLIEGVPGAGKTTATLYIMIQMLGEDHPLLKDVLFISPNKLALNEDGTSKAKVSTVNAGLKISDDRILTREEFLQQAFINYLDRFNVNGENISVKNPEDLKFIDGIYKLQNVEFNTSFKAPTLMIIDEAALWSTYDIDALMEWASNNNVRVIMLGDLQQTALNGKTEITTSNGSGNVESELFRGNFINTPKIGISMRTANKSLSDSLVTLRQAIINKKLKDLNIHHYEDEDNFIGVKVVKSSELEDTYQKLSKLTSEKIGLIPIGEPDRTLETAHPNSIQFYEGVSSSGVEGDYFIVTVDNNTFADITVKDLQKIYTAVSRATKGVIIVTDYYEQPFTDNKDNIIQNEGYSAEEIKAFSDSRYDILNQTYTKSTTSATPSSTTIEDPIIQDDNELVTPDDEVISNDDSTISIPDGKSIGYSEFTTSIQNPNDSKLKSSIIAARIDGLFGISKIIPNSEYTEQINKYIRIKSKLHYAKSLSEISSIINDELNLNNTSVELALITHSKDFQDGQERFAKDYVNENIILRNKKKEEEGKKKEEELPIKYIAAIIYNKNGEAILEIPLHTLENWATYYNNVINSRNTVEASKKEDIDSVYKECIQQLKNNPNNPKYIKLKQLIKLWRYMGNNVFSISSEDAEEFLHTRNNSGPYIKNVDISNEGNFGTFESELYELKDILEYRQFVSSDVFVSTDKNNTKIKPGYPFVLMSDNLNLTKNELYDAFMQNNNSVTLVYVTLPGLKPEEYIDYLVKVSKKELDFNTQLGTETTNIKLLYYLLKQYSEYIEKVDGLTLTSTKELFAEIEDIYNKYWDESGARISDESNIISLLRAGVNEGTQPQLFKYGKKSTVKTAVTRALIDIIGKIQDAIPDKYNDFISNLDNIFPYGIFVNAKLEKSEEATTLRKVETDGDYNIEISVDGINTVKLPLRVFGKVDTTQDLIDISKFLNVFDDSTNDNLSKINKYHSTEATNKYLNGKQSTIQEEPSLLDTVISSIINNEIRSLIEENKERIEQLAGNTIESIYNNIVGIFRNNPNYPSIAYIKHNGEYKLVVLKDENENVYKIIDYKVPLGEWINTTDSNIQIMIDSNLNTFSREIINENTVIVNLEQLYNDISLYIPGIIEDCIFLNNNFDNESVENKIEEILEIIDAYTLNPLNGDTATRDMLEGYKKQLKSINKPETSEQFEVCPVTFNII